MSADIDICVLAALSSVDWRSAREVSEGTGLLLSTVGHALSRLRRSLQVETDTTSELWRRRSSELTRTAPHPSAYSGDRPEIRADCIDGPRPCPWYSCRHHLGLHIYQGPRGEAIREVIPPDLIDVWDGPTCALDVADEGEHTLEEIGQALGFNKKRAHQVVERAMESMRDAVPEGWNPGDSSPAHVSHNGSSWKGAATRSGELQ